MSNLRILWSIQMGSSSEIIIEALKVSRAQFPG